MPCGRIGECGSSWGLGKYLFYFSVSVFNITIPSYPFHLCRMLIQSSSCSRTIYIDNLTTRAHDVFSTFSFFLGTKFSNTAPSTLVPT